MQKQNHNAGCVDKTSDSGYSVETAIIDLLTDSRWMLGKKEATGVSIFWLCVPGMTEMLFAKMGKNTGYSGLGREPKCGSRNVKSEMSIGH